MEHAEPGVVPYSPLFPASNLPSTAKFNILYGDFERTAMPKLKELMRGKDLAFYAANLPPDVTFEVSVEVVGDAATLTREQIAGVEEARRSLEFATEPEIDAVYAKYGA